MEPSLRLNGANVEAAEAGPYIEEFGFRAVTPILPLAGVAWTLVIADTSGLHCRGRAAGEPPTPPLPCTVARMAGRILPGARGGPHKQRAPVEWRFGRRAPRTTVV
jgi:hypothetical protein